MPLLADYVGAQFKLAAGFLRKVAVQASINETETADDYQCQDDEVSSKDRVGNKWIKRLIREVVSVIKRITTLLPCGKSGEEDKGCGVKQEDRFIRISRPSQT